MVFSGAIWVIPAVTHIFSVEQDGVLSPPPLQPSSLLVPHENMQKPTLCLLTLLCLIIQTREEEKKKKRKLLVTATGLGSIGLKSMAQDGEWRSIELYFGSPVLFLKPSVAKMERHPLSEVCAEINVAVILE